MPTNTVGGRTITTYNIGVVNTPTINSGGYSRYATPYYQKVLGTRKSNLLAYWPLWEASGTVAADISGNGRNGAYTAVALGAAGIGDGRTSPTFDASTSYANGYSAGLSSVFSGAEGSLLVWCKVAPASVWADSASHQIIRLRSNTDNEQVALTKPSANNSLSVTFRAAATSVGRAPATTTLGWTHLALTWSNTANQVWVYCNGAANGAAQAMPGTWAAALASVWIGAAWSTPSGVWSGSIAHVALWNVALTAGEIAALATA